MRLELKFRNKLGELLMYGDSRGIFRICGIDGLQPPFKEYGTAVYPGYDGQETIFERAEARTITIALEAKLDNSSDVLRDAFNILLGGGTLYIKNGDIDRRIECRRVQIYEVKKLIKGKLSSFVVQMVCDNPYFEDGTSTNVPLYKRQKLLSTPFTLPCRFGSLTIGEALEVKGWIEVEPVIKMYYPKALENSEEITITNHTSGAKIKLNYAPRAGETLTFDIKKRKATSDIEGNIINYLSDDTFLGDFVLKPGKNVIDIEIGDVTPEFSIECAFSNLYSEAVIV